MSETKMHYFLFHFQKFLAATKGWKDDEVGAFVKLLVEQFDRGYIPDDPEEIDRLITTRKKNWKLLAKKFTAPSEPGQLRNTFMITVRDEAHAISAVNSTNGKLGAEAKKRKQSERLAIAQATAIQNGVSVGERLDQRGLSYPVTSNQEPVNTPEEDESVNTRADLSKSNLFRQPKIPSIEQVKEIFFSNGGTDLMAQKFFDNNEATGWFYRGSPITNFVNLVPGFISTWRANDGEQSQPSQKRMVI